MELTGKCKEDFNKWYCDIFSKEEDIHDDGNSVLYMPKSMRFGVYVDFFDNVEDNEEVRLLPKISRGWKCYYTEIKGNMCKYNSRQEARIKAIEEANELYNKNSLP